MSLLAGWTIKRLVCLPVGWFVTWLVCQLVGLSFTSNWPLCVLVGLSFSWLVCLSSKGLAVYRGQTIHICIPRVFNLVMLYHF